MTIGRETPSHNGDSTADHIDGYLGTGNRVFAYLCGHSSVAPGRICFGNGGFPFIARHGAWQYREQ